jgi:hypothetical protein
MGLPLEAPYALYASSLPTVPIAHLPNLPAAPNPCVALAYAHYLFATLISQPSPYERCIAFLVA